MDESRIAQSRVARAAESRVAGVEESSREQSCSRS